VEPLIPAIVGGIHQAFSIAVSASFQIGVVTTILALLAAFVIEEIPLRATTGPEPTPDQAATGATPAPTGATGDPAGAQLSQ